RHALNSLTFVVFFVVVVTAYWSIKSWDFWLGRQMSTARDQHARRRWLVASVCMNLSMLGFFKYGNFLLQNFQWLLARVGIIYQPPHLDILLPVGISFTLSIHFPTPSIFIGACCNRR